MDHPPTKTTKWTSDELSDIEAAQELEMAAVRRDGTLRKPVPIWVVRAGDDLYVRAAYGPGTGWHRVAGASHAGRIRAGGVEKDVTIQDADDAVNDRVDAAYRARYGRYAGSIVDGITNAQARSTTLKLVPPFTSDQRAEHRRMVETNLLGAMTATDVFLDQLRDGGGDLVNVSSVAGRTARPGNAVYAATKWGMNGWSESLRQELQPDVRVMVVEPGAVATELTDHITHADTKQAIDEMYQAMSITAEDIAEVIAFAVGRPQRMTLNEILIRPTGQRI